MRRSGVLHGELAHRLALLGHTDRFVVADRGLPLPRSLPVIDLALVPGLVPFEVVLDALLGEVVVQAHVYATEARDDADGVVAGWLGSRAAVLGSGTAVPHEEFKRLLNDDRVVFAVRTGEETPYANVVLEAGVPF